MLWVVARTLLQLEVSEVLWVVARGLLWHGVLWEVARWLAGQC